MFDNIKAMGALAGLMKNKDKLKEAGERVKAKMDATRVIGEAGGGAARVIATGAMRIIEVELTHGLVLGMAADEKTRALAGSLIAEATNQALARAQLVMKETVDEEAKAMGLDGIPGLDKLFG